MKESTRIGLVAAVSSLAAPTAYVAYSCIRKFVEGQGIDWALAVVAWLASLAFSFLLTALSIVVVVGAVRLSGASNVSWGLVALAWVALIGLAVWIGWDIRRALLFLAFAGCNVFVFAILMKRI